MIKRISSPMEGEFLEGNLGKGKLIQSAWILTLQHATSDLACSVVLDHWPENLCRALDFNLIVTNLLH